MKLEGQRIVVIGGASGIGFAVASAFWKTMEAMPSYRPLRISEESRAISF